jgi:hypothetical protein
VTTPSRSFRCYFLLLVLLLLLFLLFVSIPLPVSGQLLFFFSLFRLLNNCCDLESSNRRGSWPHPLLHLCGSDRLNWGGASLRGSKVLSALGFLKCTCEPGSWFW